MCLRVSPCALAACSRRVTLRAVRGAVPGCSEGSSCSAYCCWEVSCSHEFADRRLHRNRFILFPLQHGFGLSQGGHNNRVLLQVSKARMRAPLACCCTGAAVAEAGVRVGARQLHAALCYGPGQVWEVSRAEGRLPASGGQGSLMRMRGVTSAFVDVGLRGGRKPSCGSQGLLSLLLLMRGKLSKKGVQPHLKLLPEQQLLL